MSNFQDKTKEIINTTVNAIKSKFNKGDSNMAMQQNTRLRPTIYANNAYFSSENPNISVSIDVWNNMVLLRFRNKIAQDNVNEATCYLSGQNLFAIGSAIKEIVKIRQEEYIATRTHSRAFEVPFRITKYDSQNKTHIHTGTLTIRSLNERISVAYSAGEENYEVVLNSDRVRELYSTVEDEELLSKIDLGDTAFINFAAELTSKSDSFLSLYGMMTQMFEFYVGPKTKNNGQNNGQSERNYSNNNYGSDGSFADDEYTSINDF